jgi:ataxia telangiectasia mutated family protein
MQDNHLDRSMDTSTHGGSSVEGLTKPKEESEAEADRALMVVAKKLSKTLSVGATVNELIQQASDERNLAVLYCGWAAWA